MIDSTVWWMLGAVIIVVVLFQSATTVEEGFNIYFPDCYYNASNKMVCSPYLYWADAWASPWWYSEFPRIYSNSYNLNKAVLRTAPVQWSNSPQLVSWYTKPDLAVGA